MRQNRSGRVAEGDAGGSGSETRFAVVETDDPLAGYTDKLEQRFVAKQESS